MAPLKGGVPTTSYRDVTIQRRKDDLVVASFHRSFFVLDDIEPLWDYDSSKSNEIQLCEIRTAYWYVSRDGIYG